MFGSWNILWRDTKIRLIIFFAAEDGEALYNQQKKPGADCGSDHELLIAKFRLKLKKIEKTIRAIRYDLDQIKTVFGYWPPGDICVESLLV